MAIEYHKIVRTYNDNSNFQVFVFRYDRNVFDQTLALIDMWLVTRHNGFQSKIKIDFDSLAEIVYHNPEKQLSDEEIDDMYHIFKDVIDEETKEDRQLEKLEKAIDLEVITETDRLIRAAEAALSSHPINQSIEEIVNAKNTSRS